LEDFQAAVEVSAVVVGVLVDSAVEALVAVDQAEAGKLG
jgi:uncharacterized protein YejL (UPF0352 family)